MGELNAPQIFSIAAHRGFADALVAGLVPRYSQGDFGLARLTLLLPSTRAMRTVSEAFIRYYGAQGTAGILMPRMAVVGDLDLDETLGSLLDPLGTNDIPVAVDPTRRWLRLAQILSEEIGDKAPAGATLLRLARDAAATMDRLLVEDIGPEQLLKEEIIDLLGDLSGHWQDSLRLFARVQARWLIELQAMGALDATSRRNRLFDLTAEQWKASPPENPVVAAGVTSAAPALARLLKTVSQLPGGAVILPDFDLSIDDAVWEELGAAGGGEEPGDTPFERGDAVTHPQYHMKLLLNRMGIARGEVQQWHRKGMTAASPDRTHAISSLFLPPEASKRWASLPADKRRLAGVRIMETTNPEAEAQAIALLVREALETPEKRISIVTPDRSLARRVVQHLRRWNIEADDSAGRPLPQTPAGRLMLLLAEVMAERAAPVALMALLEHPLVRFDDNRGSWLKNARKFERALRGPRLAPGLSVLRHVAENIELSDWFSEVEIALNPLLDCIGPMPLAGLLNRLAVAGEALCGDAIWSREDGRALASFVEDLRVHSSDSGTSLDPSELHLALRDAMEAVAVRPSYGGHSRVAIYGLLESRMSRTDLVICAGLNEGNWPATPSADPLLAPPVLRALGVPGADFRIGLSAHDLAGALGAPEVVLSRAERDTEGPTIPSRFLLRVKALLGEDLIARHRENEAVALAQAIDDAEPNDGIYSRPEPMPNSDQRDVAIAVTALDRLRGDPYQFYAQSILRLRSLDPLDAEPSPAWQGTVAHAILQRWHEEGGQLREIARRVLEEQNAHPLMEGLWLPRLLAALDWVEREIAANPQRKPVAIEEKGQMVIDGVRVHGRADRIDQLPGGELAIVDYKTGKPPKSSQVEAGFALQLGLIAMIAERGGIEGVSGKATAFEYWSLSKNPKIKTGPENEKFGFVDTPLKVGQKRSGPLPDEFLPNTEFFLREAIANWIKGNQPFTAKLEPDYPGYTDYDQLMRLDEWQARFDSENEQ
ncbi:double-strand break repair protein AddB [Pontixanthobacter gangjinensis]|uniref:Double-strand break repair protein AddB n=1 Tax=Pontixanthobacter gangjinensis TaxID=1028742 RepID=A0A6I4SNA3_9SPHN|nr:PD-(D/E)XK nuclease family protein [Pontixanthobacter gangjinensis]MXO57194.1 double-strand break repair protein AddB [Pontixanthobacter gangjinensis]